MRLPSRGLGPALPEIPDSPGPGPAGQRQTPQRLCLGISRGSWREVLPLRPGPPSPCARCRSSACPAPPAGTLPHRRTDGLGEQAASNCCSDMNGSGRHEFWPGTPRSSPLHEAGTATPPLYGKGLPEWLGHQPKVTQPVMGWGRLNLHRVAGPSKQISASSGGPPFLSRLPAGTTFQGPGAGLVP